MADAVGEYTMSVKLPYGFESMEQMLEAYEAEKRGLDGRYQGFPLNVKQIVEGWNSSRPDDTNAEEMARVNMTACLLYLNTSENESIWNCFYVAWIFERG